MKPYGMQDSTSTIGICVSKATEDSSEGCLTDGAVGGMSQSMKHGGLLIRWTITVVGTTRSNITASGIIRCITHERSRTMKITIQIDGEPNECALLLNALDKIGEEAQKRQSKMSTAATPCEVDTVSISDLVHRPLQGVTIAHRKESDAK